MVFTRGASRFSVTTVWNIDLHNHTSHFTQVVDNGIISRHSRSCGTRFGAFNNRNDRAGGQCPSRRANVTMRRRPMYRITDSESIRGFETIKKKKKKTIVLFNRVPAEEYYVKRMKFARRCHGLHDMGFFGSRGRFFCSWTGVNAKRKSPMRSPPTIIMRVFFFFFFMIMCRGF